jgi:heterotetrameric sarcosine oxidase gamma subunit
VNAPTRRSPAHRSHAALGAAWDTEAGWEIPASYRDGSAEAEFLRSTVAVVDITARGKIDVRGKVGASLSAAGDSLIARISPDWAMVLTEPGGEEILTTKLAASADEREMVTDATHAYAGYALVGPKLAELFSRTTAWDPATLDPGRATGASIAEIRGVMFRRDDSIVELYVSSEFGRYAWNTLLSVAQGLDGGPAGWKALRERGWS